MTDKASSLFRCNRCLAKVTREGRVYEPTGFCDCRRNFLDLDGVLVFTDPREIARERQFYDDVYAVTAPLERFAGSLEDLATVWRNPWAPENSAVLEALGDLEGKRVLLLGNGNSEKEMFFLTHGPSELICSDLSRIAVTAMKKRFGHPEFAKTLCFAAINALKLPFDDETLDLVYGYAIVHHLPKTEDFVREVLRVLRPGGRAVFMDDAYAPAWQFMKLSALYPLMKYSHRRNGISDEDLRATLDGGFRPSQLEAMITAIGGRPFIIRSSFVVYLWRRASEKLLPNGLGSYALAPWIGRCLNYFDRRMSALAWYRANHIRLVWGLEKTVP